MSKYVVEGECKEVMNCLMCSISRKQHSLPVCSNIGKGYTPKNLEDCHWFTTFPPSAMFAERLVANGKRIIEARKQSTVDWIAMRELESILSDIKAKEGGGEG